MKRDYFARVLYFGRGFKREDLTWILVVVQRLSRIILQWEMLRS